MAGLVNSKRGFGLAPHAPVGYPESPGRRGSITLDRPEHDSLERAAMPVFAAAHACRIRPSRHDLVGRFHAGRTPSFAPQR